jgi:hypothetical protein
MVSAAWELEAECEGSEECFAHAMSPGNCVQVKAENFEEQQEEVLQIYHASSEAAASLTGLCAPRVHVKRIRCPCSAVSSCRR